VIRIAIEDVKILNSSDLGRGNYRLILGPFNRSRSIIAGQFVHLQVPGCTVFFRRAFSVYDVNPEKKTLEILFKVFGRGTTLLAKCRKGDTVNLMGPLGHGFDLPGKKESVILAAGGIGMPPIYLLAKQMIQKKYAPDKIHFFYGGNGRPDLIEITRIKKLGVKLHLSTDDGSFGFKGFVTSAINEYLENNKGDYRLYACGPPAMLKAIDRLAQERTIPGQLSLEAPMPCGIGVCLGCVLPLTSGGYTRVCREGPVYDIGEVLL
jgi:dihydroorotate dehydrogenase electron transfer subunit